VAAPGETLAVAPSTRSRSERRVRSLGWKILLANHRPSLGIEAWDELIADVDGPNDVKALSLDEQVPLAPFLDALEAIAAEIADDPEAGMRRIARGFVDRWASMYRTLVDHLEGRPERMLGVAVDQVVPWFFADAELRLAATDEGEAAIDPDGVLPWGFQAGLFEGFLAQVDADPEVVREGDRLLARWPTSTPDEPHRLAVMAEATRARFLTATIVPVLVGTALAYVEGSVAWGRAAGALVSAAALHVSANLLNDVYDHRRGVDEANLTPTPFSGGSRVIQRGLLGSRRVAGLAALAGVAGTGLGLWLAASTGWPVLVLGVLGVAIGYAYSGDPIRLSHRGLGELAAGLVFGPLVAGGSYAVQTGTLSGEALLVGVPVGALMAGLLTVNELPDAEWDERTGKHTLVVRLGEASVAAIAATFGLAYASIVGLVVADLVAWPVLVALATVPLAVHVVRGVHRTGWQQDELVAYQAAAFGLHASTGLLVTVGIALGGWL
jgi:1,4-dihydroxy-2-naphthoate octaprenyltransferase